MTALPPSNPADPTGSGGPAKPLGWDPLGYKIAYTDGHTVTVRTTLAARLEVERRWPPGAEIGDDGKVRMRPPAPGLEATLLVAWLSLDGNDPLPTPEATAAAVATWAKTVAAIHETPPVDPSLPAAGDD